MQVICLQIHAKYYQHQYEGDVNLTTIQLKRIYEEPAKNDGSRILVDRLWPRGIKKEEAALDYWLKEIGPSNELRQAFHHENLSFQAFKEKYIQQLKTGKQKEAYETLISIVAKEKRVTLLFAAKNETENQAVVLKEMLERDLGGV